MAVTMALGLLFYILLGFRYYSDLLSMGPNLRDWSYQKPLAKVLIGNHPCLGLDDTAGLAGLWLIGLVFVDRDARNTDTVQYLCCG